MARGSRRYATRTWANLFSRRRLTLSRGRQDPGFYYCCATSTSVRCRVAIRLDRRRPGRARSLVIFLLPAPWKMAEIFVGESLDCIRVRQNVSVNCWAAEGRKCPGGPVLCSRSFREGLIKQTGPLATVLRVLFEPWITRRVDRAIRRSRTGDPLRRATCFGLWVQAHQPPLVWLGRRPQHARHTQLSRADGQGRVSGPRRARNKDTERGGRAPLLRLFLLLLVAVPLAPTTRPRPAARAFPAPPPRRCSSLTGTRRRTRR